MTLQNIPPQHPDFLSGGGTVGALMREHDWNATPLGDPGTWPQSLKTVVRILLTSRFQMWMAWGDDLSFFYNDAYAPTLGVKKDYALGTSARQVWKEIWPDIGPRIDRVLETGEATWDEGLLLFLERSGYPEETYHTFSYSPLSDDTGKRSGILCVVTEETERVIGERRLATLRELASSVSGKNSRGEVWQSLKASVETNLKDLPFTLTYLLNKEGGADLVCASGVPEASEIAPPQIATKSVDGIWPIAEAVRSGTTIFLKDLAKRSENIPSGYWNRPPQEALIAPIARQGEASLAGFLIVGLNPYLRNDEAYEGFVGLLAGQIASGLANADAYEAERHRAEALAEIDRAKTTFFSNTSHEFRTPLTLMLSPLEDMLARQRGEASIAVERSELDLIRRNGTRLLKLVNTLLDFSRIEAGRMQSNFEPVDLAAYTAELASTFRSAMEKAGLEFQVECHRLEKPIHVDRTMWEKIVLNLISNAFKYTLAGEIYVGVHASGEGNQAALVVRDSGVGIPADELPRLFERFHRIADQRGRTQEGTGIGLALVQELVHLHRGTVRVESKFGRGTTFTVTIPVGTDHLPADQIRAKGTKAVAGMGAHAFVDEALRWLPGSSTAPDPHFVDEFTATAANTSGERSRILLVDDNADMRDYVRRLLSEHYIVEVAGDGEEALSVAERDRPELILSDVMMPKLDGFGLLRALRGHPVLRDVPIILLSARAGEEASVEGLSAGADDYLVKPFSARELLARVRTNIEMAKLRREAVRVETQLRREAQASQERTEAILASISDGFFVLDGEWKFTYLNPAAEKLLGQPAAALIGKSHWDVYPDTNQTAVEINYRRVMSERVPVAFENYYEPWSKWFDIRAYPAGDGGLSIYFQDITERKQAEQALHNINEMLEAQVSARTQELEAKQAQLRTIFETSFTFQGLVDLDGTLRDANATALKAIGADLTDVIGQPCWDTPWFAGTPEMLRFVREIVPLVASGETIRREIQLNLPIGGWRSFDFQMRPMLNEAQDVIAIVAEAVELTAWRQAEDALRHAQKMEAIGQLTGGVAHDFNNLLTIIRSSADLLRLQNVPEDRRRRYVNAISDTADRAAKLTGQLLAFARRQALDPQVFDVVAQIEGISEMLKTVVGSRIAFRVHATESPLCVEADASQFETALVNLAANARDAIEGEGKLEVKVGRWMANVSDITAPSEAGFVTVAVTDTGCGIAKDKIDKIFEPFFTTKEVGRGTGLGLSQVYGFARQTGGTAVVESEEGKGSTFTLYLPATTKSLASDRIEGRASATSLRGRGCILVVEDNPEVGEFTSQILRELGWDAVLVSDAEQALSTLASTHARFDMVFSDVVMPGMDGVALGQEIRGRFPGMPVVLTSGYSDVLAEQGRHGFELLRKPYSVEDLSALLNRTMSEQRS